MKTQDDIIRDMWRHEDDVANHRLAWFNTIQGFLFAALAFSSHSVDPRVLILVLCFLGVVISALTFASLMIGGLAKRKLNGWWESRSSDDRNCPPVVGLYVEARSFVGLLAPSNWVPLLFIVAWLFLSFHFSQFDWSKSPNNAMQAPRENARA